MDISQVEVRIPSLSDLNAQISECIRKEVRKQMESLLHHLAQGENLSIDYLKEKYLRLTDVENVSVSKQAKKKINGDEQCRARVSTGKRCSRRCKQPDVYCGGHINSRPYGETEEADEDSESEEGDH
jgi:hypothetical protein